MKGEKIFIRVMDGMHVLLFVEFTKDFKKSSMISQDIGRELVDHGHAVSIVGKMSCFIFTVKVLK